VTGSAPAASLAKNRAAALRCSHISTFLGVADPTSASANGTI
jgi:hypothetical protein